MQSAPSPWLRLASLLRLRRSRRARGRARRRRAPPSSSARRTRARARRAAPARRGRRRSRAWRIPRSSARLSRRSARSSSRSPSAGSPPGAVASTWAIAPARRRAARRARAPRWSRRPRLFRGAAARSRSARDYLTLTKPRIMTLLLLTGAAGCSSARRACRRSAIFAVPSSGSRLRAAARRALNHVLDRDIDALMGERTKARPVTVGPRVAGVRARVRARALGALFRAARRPVNVLTAMLALVGNLFYVLVYTRWLKRSTPQNIVIGGAAGAVPPLVGYAAATGNLALPALWLFLIVFLWTPPHFWALALMIKRATRRRASRCSRSCAATARPRSRSCSTRRAWSRSPSSSGSGSGRSTPSPRSCSARCSSGWRVLLRRDSRAARARPLPLLAPLPRAALRRGGARPGAPLVNPELARRNLRFGWALFVLFCLIFAGTILVAVLYLQLD